MRNHQYLLAALFLRFGLFFAGASLHAEATLEIQIPLARTAYQTNETIPLAVVRKSAATLEAGNLVLTISGDGGSQMRFVFPVKAVSVAGNSAQANEPLNIDARMLRPDHYTAGVEVDGATAQVEFDIYSHVRRSSFRIINWGGNGQNKGEKQLTAGEDSLGYNLILGHYIKDDGANFIRAGVDFMSGCTMSGGHQMDLRSECDWSDPYVVRGGTRRVVQRAFIDRTRPNVPGVHFYDEPGLTWHKHPITGEWGPHNVPAQMRSYKWAFGRDALNYNEVDPNNPGQVAEWKHWAYWKLGLMDAAWQDSQFGVSTVRPDFLSVTQSQYGYMAFTDGYYFNVVRSLPIVSGHGGYHDWGPGYWNPSMFLEFSRPRNFTQPNWYLPAWYGSTSSDLFRLEQYLSFQTNLQGMASPPELDPFNPSRLPAAPGIIESNKLMARLGTIFNTMPVTQPPVALLYSLSHMIEKQTKDMKVTYFHAEEHGRNVTFTYLAGKLLQHQFIPVLDEDVIDGSLAAHHKAIVLTSIDYLDPKVVDGLEDFIKQGGLVLKTGDSEVKVKGAIDLGMTPALPNPKRIEQLQDELKKADLAEDKKKPLQEELGALTGLRGQLAASTPFAKAIQPHLMKASILPVFDCDQPGIAATRQASGDIEYLFAVNASHDPNGDPRLGLKATDATIRLPDDGRPVYDAVVGGREDDFNAGGQVLSSSFRFGPGQMRVFARTARPIGSVKAGASGVVRDTTNAANPFGLEISAVLLDDQGGLLTGSAPLRIRLVDPLGATRYDLHRATSSGTLRMNLPLAANDPAGQWKLTVQELLANTQDTATFEFRPANRCGALAGGTRRAIFLPGEEKNVFRFIRQNQDITIVKGTAAYHSAAAQRLAESLKPWNVKSKIVDASEVNRPRPLTEEEALTWIGLNYMGRGQIKPGNVNPPEQVGFDIRGAVILLGRPEDNPMIAFLQKNRFLPYAPSKDFFPGRGRGYYAWQLDAIGVNQESIALIAYDQAGMDEAVGSLYEAAAGIDPLTPWSFATTHTISPTTEAEVQNEGAIAWQVVLPDAVDGMRWNDRIASDPNGETFQAMTHDGTITGIQAGVSAGKIKGAKIPADLAARLKEMADSEEKPDAAAMKKFTVPGRILKKFASQRPRQAAGYWGGLVRVMDGEKLILQRQFQHDIGALLILNNELIVGLSDGRVVGMDIIAKPQAPAPAANPQADYNTPAPKGADQKLITVDMNALSLQQVCQQLTNIAGIPITCGGNFAARQVTIKVNNETLGNVLASIAKQTGTKVFERFGGFRFRAGP